MIEDQVSPKKCGHTRGKQVVSREEARMKVRAAVDARGDADILIMARTDARAVHGFDEALQRCRDFEVEGADIVFLEAPETEDEMRRYCSAMTKSCMANMVPGGKTPVLPPAKLQEIGYKLALYPVMLLSSSITAMQATLRALRPGSTSAQPAAISFTDLQGVVGFPDYWSRETKYQAGEMTTGVTVTRSPPPAACWRSSTTAACIRAPTSCRPRSSASRRAISSASPGRAR